MTKYLNLPEYVKPCWRCKGTGEVNEMYSAGCGGGYYHAMGPCNRCMPEGKQHYGYGKGTGLLLEYGNGESKQLSESVLAQIEHMNPVVVIDQRE